MAASKDPPTSEETKLLKKYLKAGATLDTAAAAAGIRRARLEYCLAKGRKLLKEGVETDPYALFVLDVDETLVDFKVRLLTLISDAAFSKQNISAAQWLYQQRYGAREMLELKAEMAALEDYKRGLGSFKPPSVEEIEAAEARMMNEAKQ